MKKCNKCGLACDEQVEPGSNESVVVFYVCPDTECAESGGGAETEVVERDGTRKLL